MLVSSIFHAVPNQDQPYPPLGGGLEGEASTLWRDLIGPGVLEPRLVVFGKEEGDGGVFLAAVVGFGEGEGRPGVISPLGVGSDSSAAFSIPFPNNTGSTGRTASTCGLHVRILSEPSFIIAISRLSCAR